MSADAIRDIPETRTAWAAPNRVLRLANPRDSGRFGEHSRPEGGDCARGTTPHQREKESQFDTGRDVSSWHGPRFAAPFAAQVIAQALCAGGCGALSARTAYRGGAARVPPALLVDDSI